MIDFTMYYVVSVFIAGVLSFFAPCIIPLLPVYVATLSGNVDEEESNQGNTINEKKNGKKVEKFHWKLVGQTLVFILGLGTSFMLMGFGAGEIGRLVGSKTFLTFCGGLVILLGLHQIGIFQFIFLERERKIDLTSSKRNGTIGSYLLGISFSFGWTPCVGPVLATVLAIASNGNAALYGAGLMLVYTLGLAVPFLLISLFTSKLLNFFKKIRKYLPQIRVAGGIMIIIMGILLMTDNLNIFAQIFN